MQRQHSSGQVLALFAILAPIILGLAGLGLDGARMMLERRHQQGAADLAALAGARSLPGAPGSTQRTQAMTTALSMAAANGYPSGVTVTFPDDSHIRVVIDHTVDMTLAAIVGNAKQQVSAGAVAVRQQAVLSAASVPLTGPAVLAQLSLCGTSGKDVLKWTGASATINGDVITNSGGDISGSNNYMNGTETYYSTASCTNQFTPHSNPNPPTKFNPVTVRTSFPIDPTKGALADPIGAGICDWYMKSSDEIANALPTNYNGSTRQITNGVYCRTNNLTNPTALASKINLKTNNMWCDRCTFIGLDFQASGTAVNIKAAAIAVTSNGSTCAMPANTCGGYPLLVYTKGCPTTASCTPDPKNGVNWSGASASWNGVMFTPSGLSYISGANSSIYNGAVWGRTVEVSGFGFTLNGPSGWPSGGGLGVTQPEVLALVE